MQGGTKRKKLIESEPFQKLRKTSRPPCDDVYFQAKVLQGGTKRLARRKTEANFKLDLPLSEIKNKSSLKASHSKDCGKRLARLVMMFISKLKSFKAELKKQKLIESEPFQKLRKTSRPPCDDVHF